ncbi:MAG: hypothetical protein JHD16_04650 [Solirubrobacteraceae bacterium]|nr:hypothetical protein [Solirubrobacteraceae bacterium]
MPTTIYLSTGDELTVTAPYEEVLEQWQNNGRVELTALWWTDPESSGFDPLSEWPTYRESRITIDLSAAFAVEDEDAATIAAIERARLHQLDQE